MTEQPEQGGDRRDGARSAERHRVVIAGHGLLATVISEWLSADPRLDVTVRARDVPGFGDLGDLGDLTGEADLSGNGQVLITASDGWDSRGLERIQALCAARRMTWL